MPKFSSSSLAQEMQLRMDAETSLLKFIEVVVSDTRPARHHRLLPVRHHRLLLETTPATVP
jgi:hypothetical protein